MYVWESDGSFSKLNFTKFVNRCVKILLGRFYSPSLKDGAWLERAVCKFGSVEAAARDKKITDKCMKNSKNSERLLSNLHSSNLLNTIFFLVF